MPIFRCPWWLILGSVLIPAIYIPMLWSPFDCTEDSCIVYPPEGTFPTNLFHAVASSTLHEFKTTGPFRPVTWAHWHAAAGLFGPDPVARRVARLVWCGFATATLLLLLTEFGTQPGAALLVAAFVQWNPFRSEIWISLAMPEAYAMPYAMLALVCALRASRAVHQQRWDAAGVILLLLCLGIKNVFIALIPPLVWLRLMAGSRPWRLQMGGAVCYLALSILPIIHFVWLKIAPTPEQYTIRWSVLNVLHFGRALYSTFAIGVTWPALLLLFVLVPLRELKRFRVELIAAGLLFLAGFIVYLPIPMMYSRYTMPSVWGLDLLLALSLTVALSAPLVFHRLTVGVLFVMLLVIGWRGLLRQDEIIMRNRLNWQALLDLEQRAEQGTSVAVVYPSGTTTFRDISQGEAFHLVTHLRMRGRSRAELQITTTPQDATLLLAGERFDPGSGYNLVREFRAERTLFGSTHRCRLWRREKS